MLGKHARRRFAAERQVYPALIHDDPCAGLQVIEQRLPSQQPAGGEGGVGEHGRVEGQAHAMNRLRLGNHEPVGAGYLHDTMPGGPQASLVSGARGNGNGNGSRFEGVRHGC